MCVCHCIGAPRSASECRCSWHNMYMCHELEMCVYRCMRPALGWEVFVTHILVTNSKFARCRISAPYALSHVSTFMWMCVVFVTQYVSICHETKCVCGGVMVPYALSHVSTFTWVRVVFVTQYIHLSRTRHVFVSVPYALPRMSTPTEVCTMFVTQYIYICHELKRCVWLCLSRECGVRDIIYIHLSRTQHVCVAVYRRPTLSHTCLHSRGCVWCSWRNMYPFVTNSQRGVSGPYAL